MADLRLQDLSRKSQEALQAALAGKPVTLDNIRGLSQRDIWIMPGYGRGASNEIKAWAARHGIEMPERSTPDPQ